ncbi:DUF11 domain-containing protein [Methylocucumis oryzae]|uniref:DUF11 domain-containing protein n=1 Tax=Methylocucumis oryzae TaxID=1632867 RepID=UPI000698F3A7|nr:DUF11 domain-containing protein [Methylocucumis oryzae]
MRFLFLPLVLLASSAYAGHLLAAETQSIGSKAGDPNSYAGSTWASVSADGRYTSVTASVGFFQHIFLYDRYSKTAKDLTATGNSISLASNLAANGKVVAFQSVASNLVSDDTNGLPDIFVQDIQSGKNQLISKASDGTAANAQSHFAALSGDGQWVAFSSSASNLVANDSNNAADIFLHDRKTGKTTRVSVSSSGQQAESGVNNGVVDISADGRYVVFSSLSGNLVAGDANSEDVFIRDVKLNTTTRASVPVKTSGGFDGKSTTPSISSDGRYIAYSSGSSKLTANDSDDFNSDIFVYDRINKTNSKITKNADGQSILPMISGDGRYIAFFSSATNLVANDSNNAWDSFVYDRNTGKTTRINVTPTNEQSTGDITFLQARPSLSADGRFIAFETGAKDITADDTDSAYTDVFLRDMFSNKAKAANVSVSATTPASVSKNQAFNMTLTISNLGPNTATQTNVFINLPSYLTLTAVTPNQGQCVKSAASICRLGSLTSGASTTVTVKATAPSFATTINLSATAQSIEKDSSVNNNFVTKAVVVK